MSVIFPNTLTRSSAPQTIAADAYAIPLLRPDAWLAEAAEGELAVDVYETVDAFTVQAALAGVAPDALTLAIHHDLLTIRGERSRPRPSGSHAGTDHAYGAPLTQECYWGKFSRSILLPEQVDTSRATATLAQGVLTVVLPKRIEATEISVAHDADASGA